MDFIKYARIVDIKNQQTMGEYAEKIKEEMESILQEKVVNSTNIPSLQNSIEIYTRPNEVEIVPEKDYARWVEDGHHGFHGYQFVKGATNKYREQYLKELQNNLIKI